MSTTENDPRLFHHPELDGDAVEAVSDVAQLEQLAELATTTAVDAPELRSNGNGSGHIDRPPVDRVATPTPPQKSRKRLVGAAVAAVAVAAGSIGFAVSRGGQSESTEAGAPAPVEAEPFGDTPEDSAPQAGDNAQDTSPEQGASAPQEPQASESELAGEGLVNSGASIESRLSEESLLSGDELAVLSMLKDGGEPFGQEWAGPTLDIPQINVADLSILPDGVLLDEAAISADPEISAVVTAVNEAECSRRAAAGNLRDPQIYANALGYATAADALSSDPGFVDYFERMESGELTNNTGYRRVNSVSNTAVQRNGNGVTLSYVCDVQIVDRLIPADALQRTIDRGSDPFMSQDNVYVENTYDIRDGRLVQSSGN